MAKTFFEVIAGKGGIAGEYEALTEAEIAAAPGAAYTPPEIGNFRVVASRVVQLLADSPIYFETFQTSAATLRVPSGATATNDAEDGRFYFIRNSITATGILTVQDSAGTELGTLNTGDLAIVIHGENNAWDITDPISGTDGFGGAFRYTRASTVPGSGTRYLRTSDGIDVSTCGDRLIQDVRITGISIRVDSADASRSYTVEVLSDPSGTPAVLASLTLPVSSTGAGRNDLAVFVTAPTEIGVRVVLATGSGASSFSNINVNVQVG